MYIKNISGNPQVNIDDGFGVKITVADNAIGAVTSERAKYLIDNFPTVWRKSEAIELGGGNPGSSTGNPTGSVTPDIIGQIYVNTSGPVVYVAVGLTASDWKEVAILL